MKTRPKPPQRFSHVHLEHWRNFAQADVALERRVFLAGPNASGKSNLLDAFRFLHDLATVGGGLQEAVRRRGGVSNIRCLAARRNPDVVIQVQLAGVDSRENWEYELRLTQGKHHRPVVQQERVARGAAELLRRPLAEDRRDPERLTQTYLEQVNVNKEFRAVAAFFASLCSLHLVPELVREPGRSAARRNDPYGSDFLEQLGRTPEKLRTGRLRQIRAALRVAIPQLKDLEVRRDARGVAHLRGKYEHWHPPGAWQTEEQFSDGTLRLMGLLWAMLEGTGPLLLEEPELSLHPAVVRFIPQMMARIQRRSGRQIFVSTHSPEILADEGIGLDELLLFEPGAKGTRVRPAGDFADIKALLAGGSSLAEAALPRTHPPHAGQLTLFGE